MGSNEREREMAVAMMRNKERGFEEIEKGERAWASILMMGMTSTLHDMTDWHNLMRNREREGWAHSICLLGTLLFPFLYDSVVTTMHCLPVTRTMWQRRHWLSKARHEGMCTNAHATGCMNY